MFIAQHRPARDPANPSGGRNVVGYFGTLSEAQAALDERLEDGAWQGIRSMRTHETWWRETSTAWEGPFRSRPS